MGEEGCCGDGGGGGGLVGLETVSCGIERMVKSTGITGDALSA